MPRINFNQERRVAFKEKNIGHLILYCEGYTEKMYFEFFRSIIHKSRFDEIQVEVITAGGNSSRVLNYAVEHLTEEENNRKYSNYTKYLVFDCDAPDNIQEVIQSINVNPINFNMLLSNSMFEVWLLMHFEELTSHLTRSELFFKLNEHLGSKYSKANEGIIRGIMHLGSVEKAILNAEALEKQYKTKELTICENILEMKPYTTVHHLIKKFISKINSNIGGD